MTIISRLFGRAPKRAPEPPPWPPEVKAAFLEECDAIYRKTRHPCSGCARDFHSTAALIGHLTGSADCKRRLGELVAGVGSTR